MQAAFTILQIPAGAGSSGCQVGQSQSLPYSNVHTERALAPGCVIGTCQIREGACSSEMHSTAASAQVVPNVCKREGACSRETHGILLPPRACLEFHRPSCASSLVSCAPRLRPARVSHEAPPSCMCMIGLAVLVRDLKLAPVINHL